MRTHPPGCLCIRCVDDDEDLYVSERDIEDDDGEFDDDEMGVDPEDDE